MQETNEKIIDVVEEFICPHQTDTYNIAFQTWRRQKKNRYAFRFIKNLKETSFAENRSVVNDTPVQAAQTVLHRLGTLFGYVLVCALFIENVLDKALVLLFEGLGFHIEILYLGESRLFGEEWLVFCIAAGIYLLKFLVPALIASSALQMPLCVSLPLPATQPLQILMGMFLMMLTSMGTGMFLTSSSAEMEKYRLISIAVGDGDYRLILYVLFTVLIAPLAAELLLHGCLFQALRQFGDSFAIVTITILSALLTHNLQDAVRMCIVTLTISYFMIKSGSFLTAAILHVVHEVYMFALFYIRTFGEIYSLQWWLLILLPCTLGSIAAVFLLIHRKQHPEEQVKIPVYLNIRDQMTSFFTAMPMLIFSVACLLLLVMTTIL